MLVVVLNHFVHLLFLVVLDLLCFWVGVLEFAWDGGAQASLVQEFSRRVELGINWCCACVEQCHVRIDSTLFGSLQSAFHDLDQGFSESIGLWKARAGSLVFDVPGFAEGGKFIGTVLGAVVGPQYLGHSMFGEDLLEEADRLCCGCVTLWVLAYEVHLRVVISNDQVVSTIESEEITCYHLPGSCRWWCWLQG